MVCGESWNASITSRFLVQNKNWYRSSWPLFSFSLPPLLHLLSIWLPPQSYIHFIHGHWFLRSATTDASAAGAEGVRFGCEGRGVKLRYWNEAACGSTVLCCRSVSGEHPLPSRLWRILPAQQDHSVTLVLSLVVAQKHWLIPLRWFFELVGHVPIFSPYHWMPHSLRHTSQPVWRSE